MVGGSKTDSKEGKVLVAVALEADKPLVGGLTLHTLTSKRLRRPARSAPLAANAAVGDSAKDQKGQLGTKFILLPGLLSLGTLLSPDTANGIYFLPSTHPLDPMPAI